METASRDRFSLHVDSWLTEDQVSTVISFDRCSQYIYINNLSITILNMYLIFHQNGARH